VRAKRVTPTTERHVPTCTAGMMFSALMLIVLQSLELFG